MAGGSAMVERAFLPTEKRGNARVAQLMEWFN